MTNKLRVRLETAPLLTAVVYTGMGVLPLFLISSQILQLEADIGFGVAELGLATAAFFGAAALSASGAGRFVSHRGAAAGIRAGSVATIAACVVAGLASTWWLVPISALLGGVGNGFMQVGSNITIFEGVDRTRQGIAFGSKQASVPLASVLAGLSLPVIGLVFGWRWVFAGAALLAVGLAVSTPGLDGGISQRRIESAVGRPTTSMLWLGLAGLTGAAAGNGLSLFIVPSAVDVGIDEAAAGAVLAVCSLLVVGLRIGAGWLVDRRASTGHIEMALMAGIGVAGGLLLMFAKSPSLYLFSMPLALLGAWGWPGVIFFTAVNSYPDFPARASGLLLSTNLTGTVIGPLVVGALAGRGHYPEAWGFVSICAAIAAIGFLKSRR